MKAMIWLSFDLGVRGDYEGMYGFLDSHGAKECGDSLAVFEFEYRKDLLVELTKEIREHVTVDKRTRVYVIRSSSSGKSSGKFIFGKRKASPWTGYGSAQVDEEDVSE